MKWCEWCGKDVGKYHGFLSYWDKNNDIQTGYWHPDCWEEYWKERSKGVLRRIWDRLCGSNRKANGR